MIEWITEHWHTLTATFGGSAIVVWGWISAHHGKIRTGYQWIVKQFRLTSENADLTKQLAAAHETLKSKNFRLADSDTNAKELETQRDIMAKKLEPPALHEGEINIIRFLAVRGVPIESYRLCFSFEMERTRFDHYINRLTGTFRYVRLRTYSDTRAEVYELTESGKAYAVTNNFC